MMKFTKLKNKNRIKKIKKRLKFFKVNEFAHAPSKQNNA